MKIFPSLIAANPLTLQTTIDSLDSSVDGYHIDIMDDHFVPNLTWGPFVINALAKATNKPLWIHLMADHTLSLIERIDAGPNSIVSFHIETKESIENIIIAIKRKKWLVSCAISPKTDLKSVFPYWGVIDHLLVMSVNPGFSGQQFLDASIERAELCNHHRKTDKLPFTIGMDGGITSSNIEKIQKAGVDQVAVAHAIFQEPTIEKQIEAIAYLKTKIRRSQ